MAERNRPHCPHLTQPSLPPKGMERACRAGATAAQRKRQLLTQPSPAPQWRHGEAEGTFEVR